MPVPNPRKGEKKEKFIPRCISFLTKEGKHPAKQIQAMCFGSWERHTFQQSNVSSILLQFGERRILIDYGQGNIGLPEVTDIILSHAHPDHAFGLKGQELDIPVHVNKYTNRLLSRTDFPFRRNIFWRKPFYIGDVKITPVPVMHSIKAPANGFVIQVSGRKLAIFPDVLQIKKLQLLEHSDLYIGDGASLDEDVLFSSGGKHVGHASIRTQLKWLQNLNVKRAIFTHFGEWAISGNLHEVFKALSEEFNIKVDEVYDSYKLRFGETIHLERGEPDVSLMPPKVKVLNDGKRTLVISAEPIPERYIGQNLFFLQSNKTFGVLTIPKSISPQSVEDVNLGFSPSSKEVYVYEAGDEKIYVTDELVQWLRIPYVLSQQAISENYVPPFGISGLPSSIRNIIPDKYKYWVNRNISERLALRNKLVKAIDEGEVKISWSQM